MQRIRFSTEPSIQFISRFDDNDLNKRKHFERVEDRLTKFDSTFFVRHFQNIRNTRVGARDIRL